MRKIICLVILGFFVSGVCFADTVQWKVSNRAEQGVMLVDEKYEPQSPLHKKGIVGYWVSGEKCTESDLTWSCDSITVVFFKDNTFKLKQLNRRGRSVTDPSEMVSKEKASFQSSLKNGTYKIIDDNMVELQADWAIPQDLNPLYKEDLYCSRGADFSGPCRKVCYAVEVNPESKKCQQINGSCCSSYSPFESLEECQQMCESVDASDLTEDQDWGEVVGGLRMRLSADRTTIRLIEVFPPPVPPYAEFCPQCVSPTASTTRSPFEDLQFTIELRNVSNEKKVIPIELCEYLQWQAYARVCLRVGSREDWCSRANPIGDVESKHPHAPLEIHPHQTLRHQFVLSGLHDFALRRSEVLEALAGHKRFTVWVEFPEFSGSNHKETAQMWKGRLRSNTLTIPVRSVLSRGVPDDSQKVDQKVSKTVFVYADQPNWQPTGIIIEAGTRIRFKARGRVVHWQSQDKSQSQTCGPNGVKGTTREMVYLAPGLKKNALVGKIGNHFFNVGSKATVRAPTSGELFLGMNDTNLYAGTADNSGYWTVEIKVPSCRWKHSSPSTPIIKYKSEEQENIVPKEEKSLELTIEKLGYTPGKGLEIGATFKNVGDENILLAHPSICIPDSLQEGDYFNMVKIGKSELTCQIIWPNGEQITLINAPLNPYFIFPDGSASPVLFIQPGESKKIVLAKFGYQYSQPYWNHYPDRPIEAPLFPLKGQYQITLSYTNTLARVTVTDLPQPVWQGIVTSNTMTVEIGEPERLVGPADCKTKDDINTLEGQYVRLIGVYKYVDALKTWISQVELEDGTPVVIGYNPPLEQAEKFHNKKVLVVGKIAGPEDFDPETQYLLRDHLVDIRSIDFFDK